MRRSTPTSPRHFVTRACQTAAAGLVAALLAGAAIVRGDQIEMQNGDRYSGKVLTVNADTIFLQNDNLGTIRLPRAKVASIALGNATTPRTSETLSVSNTAPPITSSFPTNNADEVAAQLRQLASHTNLITQVQSQILGGAGPEATAKFNELLTGLSSGSITLNDLRAQAKTAADQLRAAKKDLGEDSGFAVDSYLSILENFLKETEPPAGTGATPPNTSVQR